MKILLVFFLLSINLFSSQLDNLNYLDQNRTKGKPSLSRELSIYQKLSSLDYMQKSISRKVLIFSSNLDHTLSRWLKHDRNISEKKVVQEIEEEKDAYSFYSIVNIYDNFFKKETYLNTTQKDYLRIRFGVEENHNDKFSYLNNIRLKLKLPKTEESLHLIIGDEEDDTTNTIDNGTVNENISVGIKYFFENLDIFNANIHAGFKGIDNPLIRLRMEYPIMFRELLFRPVQYIEYSSENKFKEETRFYFDYKLKDRDDLIRLSLSRYTQTDLNGINYSGQLSYLNNLNYDIGYQIYTNFSGRTKLTGNEPVGEEYNVTPTVGVYNYKSGIIWKQQFFKEYLFYELHPVVEFAEKYEYNANYIFRANLELYFGNI